MQDEIIDYAKADRDANGNSRYIVHFLNFADDYDEAVYISREIVGGKKYRAKWYGGGIVFQSHNIKKDLKAIADYRKEAGR